MPQRHNASQLVSDLLSQWDSDITRPGHDPLPFLTSLTEVVEQEAILFWKHNPDPFDDRHPTKINSDCQYGSILKKIFKNDGFIQRMIDDYCTSRGDPGPVQTMAVRLVLSLLPGVESSVFFRDNEEVVERLYDLADKQPRDSEIRAYAIGILGSAMQAELSVNFREHNQRIASAVLEELWEIIAKIPPATSHSATKRPITNGINTEEPSAKQRRLEPTVNGHGNAPEHQNGQFMSPVIAKADEMNSMLSDVALIIGDNSLYPITPNVRQRLYLQFLSPVAQYQDMLPVMTKFNVMSLVDAYLDMRRVGDARLTFEALCLLASLLCHRKLASEFIQQQASVSRLLSSVPRTTLPAAGVALCLYYLSYFEHTANRMCSSLSRPVLIQLMEYALGLVQSGYVSSRNHAALFLAAMLPYNQILEVFDSCNGIGYLYNSLSTLAIFHSNPNEDDTVVQSNANGSNPRPGGRGDDSGDAADIEIADLINGARHRQAQHAAGAGGNAILMADGIPVAVQIDGDDDGDDSDDDTDDDEDDNDSMVSGEEERDKDSDEVVAAAQAARYPALAMKAYFDTHLHLRATSSAAKGQNGVVAPVASVTTPSAAFPPFGSLSPTASSVGPQTLPAPSVHTSLAVVQASPDQRHADLDVVLDALSSQTDASIKPGPLFRKSAQTAITWLPIQKFSLLNGPELLVRLAHMLIGQDAYTGRTETLVAIFDSLAACCLERSVSTSMCQPLECPRCPDRTSGVIVALEATHSERAGDASVVKSALSFLTVLCTSATSDKTKNSSPMAFNRGVGYLSTPSTNMVFSRQPSSIQAIPTTPLSQLVPKGSVPSTARHWAGTSRPPSPLGEMMDADNADEKNRPPSPSQPISVFDCIQMNDGIMRLRDLLFTKTPVTEADSIRMHACRVLLGLAQSDTIRQILSRLSLFDHGQLQSLVKEPVLQDKLAEHTRFCRLASELAERVSGMRLPTEEEMREQMRRTGIVARTSYRYDKRELVLLMYSFLRVNGLEQMMSTLLAEGNLSMPTRSSITPLTQMLELLPSKRTNVATRIAKMPVCVAPPKPSSLLRRRQSLLDAAMDDKGNPPPPGVRLPLTVRHSPAPRQPSFLQRANELASQSDLGTSRSFNDNSDVLASTLDNIVAAYLREQHSACPVPMSICPTFSLLSPHRCPVPLATANCAPFSLPRRSGMCHVIPGWGGPHGRRLNRQFVFSRFQPIRTIRHAEHLQFTCCSFLPTCSNGLAIGTDTGDVLMFDADSGSEVSVFTCHPSPLAHIQFAPWYDSNQLFVTSSTWGQPLSALWSMRVPTSGITERDAQPDQKASLTDDNYVEFGHSSSSSSSTPFLIGTQESIAHLYDLTTGNLLMTLFDSERSSGYSYNRAHLDPADKLVLSDGLLWDVKTKKPIHKFDKLNADVSGVFHPSGLEVIINCEVWDLRTYRLLRTVPDLNQCSIVFSGTGEVLYGAVIRSDPDFFASANHPGAGSRSPFGSMFRTFHADDYTPIASVDVKRTIFDLAVHPDDHTVALVDNDMNSSTNDGGGDSCARLYAVGLAHPPENAADGESDHEEQPGDDDDDDDSDDSDNEDDDSSLTTEDSADDSSDDSGGPVRIGSASSRAGDHEHSTRSRGGVISPPPVLAGGAGTASDIGSPVLFGRQQADSTAAGEGGDDSSEDADYEPANTDADDDDEDEDEDEDEDNEEDDDDDDDDDDEDDSSALSSDSSSDGWSSPRYQLSDRSRSEM